MRNRHPGTCYRCGERVEVGEGHFERFQGGWRTQHASCAILYRGKPESPHIREDLALAKGVGPAAQRARQRLRKIGFAGGHPDPIISATSGQS